MHGIIVTTAAAIIRCTRSRPPNWFLNEYNNAAFQLEYARKSGVVPVNQKAIESLKSDPVLAEMLHVA